MMPSGRFLASSSSSRRSRRSLRPLFSASRSLTLGACSFRSSPIAYFSFSTTAGPAGRLEPSDDLYAVISLRDHIEDEALSLVGPNRKLTPSELRSLYRKATGKVLTAGALAQVLEAIPHGSGRPASVERP